jgi:hypothetical protein
LILEGDIHITFNNKNGGKNYVSTGYRIGYVATIVFGFGQNLPWSISQLIIEDKVNEV